MTSMRPSGRNVSPVGVSNTTPGTASSTTKSVGTVTATAGEASTAHDAAATYRARRTRLDFRCESSVAEQPEPGDRG
jgi:hypothetical protein